MAKGKSGRSLHGERGLKLNKMADKMVERASLPSRGAWIEIFEFWSIDTAIFSRSLHGERGLKFC